MQVKKSSGSKTASRTSLVGTVAIDGARNAAMLAARILALKYPEFDKALKKAARKERSSYEQTADEALGKLSAK